MTTFPSYSLWCNRVGHVYCQLNVTKYVFTRIIKSFLKLLIIILKCKTCSCRLWASVVVHFGYSNRNHIAAVGVEKQTVFRKLNIYLKWNLVVHLQRYSVYTLNFFPRILEHIYKSWPYSCIGSDLISWCEYFLVQALLWLSATFFFWPRRICGRLAC